MPPSPESQRLAKYLAACGVASRRASEAVIAAGRVTVNGETVTTPAFNVIPGTDRILLDGKPVAQQKKIWIALNKPPGYTCSAQDEHAARLVFELLPGNLGRLFTVGRLDRDSEGLLLLTNDGDRALHLAHPRYETTKIYRVWTPTIPTPELLQRLTDGLEDAGQFLRARSAHVSGRAGAGAIVELVLTEGRKREIRRMFDALGLSIQRLQRVSHGPIRIGPLRPGEWRLLTPAELTALDRFVPATPATPAIPPKKTATAKKTAPEIAVRTPNGSTKAVSSHRHPGDSGSHRNRQAGIPST